MHEYKNDKLHGVSRYFTDHEVSKIEEYENGEIHGFIEEYTEDDIYGFAITFEAFYLFGQLIEVIYDYGQETA